MNRRTHQEWLALFEQHRHSGLTIKAFCQENQLNPNYFSKRRNELESLTQDNTQSPFIRLHPGNIESSSITLGYGQVQLNLSPSISPEWLAVLVRALA